jgi:hypothetical protein
MMFKDTIIPGHLQLIDRSRPEDKGIGHQLWLNYPGHQKRHKDTEQIAD